MKFTATLWTVSAVCIVAALILFGVADGPITEPFHDATIGDVQEAYAYTLAGTAALAAGLIGVLLGCAVGALSQSHGDNHQGE